MIIFLSAWFMTPIPVGTVAQAMRIEAERYFAKNHQDSKDEQQNLYFNAEIRDFCKETQS